MQTLYYTVKEWNRSSWSMQEVLCKKYDVILTDYQTRKEKTISLLNKINMKNFNKGMDMFNKSLDKFGKTVDSLTSKKSGFNQGKSMDVHLIRQFSKDMMWGKPVRLIGSSVSILPEKTKSDTPKDNVGGIWGKRDDG